MRTVAIVQARMGSTRLPGKVLAPIGERPMLARVLERVGGSRRLDFVGVATTDRPADDEIAHLCASLGVACFRGSESDVLARYAGAARAWKADVVVRITADCPLMDPAVVDRVVDAFLEGGCDYASNTIRYTWPDGLDVEVFSRGALERACREARRPSEREHVTPYLKEKGRFRLRSVERTDEPDGGERRWTVDDAADLEFVRAVYGAFGDATEFGVREVESMLRADPALRRSGEAGPRNEAYYSSLFHQAPAEPAPPLALERSRALFARSRRVIPGCAQTFSKGYTQYVEGAPRFLERGHGSRVWDVDGNEYVDYVQGLLPNILGYAHEGVNAAVAARCAEGHSFSLPHRLEVELAEKLCELIPCAEMVRFGKNGSDATSGAIRAARAHTGRDHVTCCGYHGWQDWYIGATSRHRGVPGSVRGLTHVFPYNDLPALERILAEHPCAAVIMEPVTFEPPASGYLEGVRELAHGHGAVLIFDEIITGFRFGLGGAQARYGVVPDLACFGKAMGNGHPISCIVGRREIMEVFEEVFFSFTFAGEASAMAAALAVIEVLAQPGSLAHMAEQGGRLRDGFNVLARESGLAECCRCIGHDTWSKLELCDTPGRESLLVRSLFQQEAVRRGVLVAATHNMTTAHDGAVIDRTLEVYASVLKVLSRWLSDRDPARFLEGKPIQPVFRPR